MTEKVLQEIRRIAGSGEVLFDEPMEKHTTFRIGGPADVFVRPETKEQIAGILRLCREAEIPVFLLGNGSNLLVSDDGFRGVILQLDRNYQACSLEEECIKAQAGALLAKVASLAAKAGLTGLEFASGIPGTVGGGVIMNDGAYGGELKKGWLYARYLKMIAKGA